MTMSVTPVYEGTLVETHDVIATADGDTGTLDIPHGLAVEPDLVFLTVLLAPAILSQWSLTSKDAAKAVVTKNGTGVGSGDAAAQLRVTVIKLHSIVS